MSIKNPARWTRRDFLGAVAATSTLAPAAASVSDATASDAAAFGAALPSAENDLSIHVFSKHLQFLDYDAMAEAAAEIGFDGVDLTVRPGGHVLPENVITDLPRAVAAIKQAGLQAKIMTTKVMSTEGGTTEQLLKTAREQGITHYRTDWLHYDREAIGLPDSLVGFRRSLTQLAQLNERIGIVGGYQNHAGEHYVGAPVWDIATLLNEVGSDYLGSQYDIRHATVEGGFAWPIGLNLIHPQINVLVIKDFRWEQVDGIWKVVNTPVGEGMVDFPRYFSLLKQYEVRCPISVHFEYEMPEEQSALSEEERRVQTVSVMKKDVDTIRKHLKEAGLL